MPTLHGHKHMHHFDQKWEMMLLFTKSCTSSRKAQTLLEAQQQQASFVPLLDDLANA